MCEYWRQTSRKWQTRIFWYKVSKQIAHYDTESAGRDRAERLPRIREGTEARKPNQGAPARKHVYTAFHKGKHHEGSRIPENKRGDSTTRVHAARNKRDLVSKQGKIFWKANDGSTGQLELVAKENVPNLIQEQFYNQGVPSGMRSLHSWIVTKYLGVSYQRVAEFVRKQGQLQKPLRRPFELVEIDIGVMTSFDQTQKGDPTCILVL